MYMYMLSRWSHRNTGCVLFYQSNIQTHMALFIYTYVHHTPYDHCTTRVHMSSIVSNIFFPTLVEIKALWRITYMYMWLKCISLWNWPLEGNVGLVTFQNPQILNYVYVHIHTYIHVYVHICTCIYMYIYMYMYVIGYLKIRHFDFLLWVCASAILPPLILMAALQSAVRSSLKIQMLIHVRT